MQTCECIQWPWTLSKLLKSKFAVAKNIKTKTIHMFFSWCAIASRVKGQLAQLNIFREMSEKWAKKLLGENVVGQVRCGYLDSYAFISYFDGLQVFWSTYRLVGMVENVCKWEGWAIDKWFILWYYKIIEV